MASRLIFDTNYIRKLGVVEYLDGTVPQKFAEQLKLAINRGDVVCIPRTVQMELNAWVNEVARKNADEIDKALSLLVEKGFKVEPCIKPELGSIDAISIIKNHFNEIYIVEPSLDDYFEAERRTSLRSSPIPKNPQGEEYRDRLIWCQTLSLSVTANMPTIIVSEDKIFENGANSTEGNDANISIIKNEEELNQWLDQRPEHIQKIIDDIALFADELNKQDIEINADKISRVVDYRSVNEPNGSKVKKFQLLISDDEKQLTSLACKIIYQGNTPVSINVNFNNKDVQCGREFEEKELHLMTINRHREISKKQFQEIELQQLLGN
ncbi:MAG: hypothetical protein ACI9N3_000783 [Colwellia sp.]|jgi:hypothetical protein